MKCILWFYDGNVRTFYAPAPSKRGEEKERERAFRHMIKLITITFKGTWRSAVIYENGGKELAAYYQGKRIR